jgi:hypothetical protein
MADPCKRTWYLRELDLFRELSEDEIREHALDLANQGMAKALPTLEL